MHFRIQMRDQGTWCTLGGRYDAVTADERVAQFIAACSHNGGTSREFRIVAEDGHVRSARVLYDAKNKRNSKGPVADEVVDVYRAILALKTLASKPATAS